MHLYKFFLACRSIVLIASVKLRTGGPEMGQIEQDCAHQKSYRKQIYQNISGAVVHLRDRSCTPTLQFFSATSDGATSEQQIQNRIFGQFFSTSLRKDSVDNYASIWKCFRLLVEDQMYFATHKTFRRSVATTFTTLRWIFSKT